LRLLAPELDVLLLEKNPAFWSCPLSNRWLVGQVDGTLLRQDYARAAQASGYRFVQAEATAIDRDARRVVTTAGSFDYDWLVLAVGIRHDYSAWFADDRASAQLAEQRYPAAWTSGNEHSVLREKLDRFKGGDFLMTVPPVPYRCPPAPFERAALVAGWLEARGISARLVIIDPNPPFQEFQRIFRERHGERIVYRAQTPILAVDLQRRRVETDFEEFGFDDAILMPPQQAAGLAWQAGLIGRDAAGKPTGWAAVDPLRLAARADPHIFMIGDMIDRVSPLFGHYPKSGHMAIRQGHIVARQIAALSHDKTAPQELPDSLCHIATRFDPPEAIRLGFNYRIRADGEIAQQMNTRRDVQPRGEDIDWLKEMYREMFGLPS
jgi:NADPH-dependent 2,4-dienoyl-CoA reductase/sulfur reductase-like enzyme